MTPAKDIYRFSLALLFYNEEENIVPVVTSLQSRLSRAGLDFQLVLVNNGSQDRTPALIRQLVLGDSRLKEVNVEKNLGYGWGAINGLMEARGEWIGYMDGDAQIDAGAVVRFLEKAGEEFDMVKVRRGKRQDSFLRARISETYIVLFSLLFGIPLYDINAKPIIFRREWREKFDLSSRDWFIDAELLLKAVHLKLRIGELPVVFRKRGAGRSSVKPVTILEFIRNIIRYRFGGELKQWKKKIELRS